MQLCSDIVSPGVAAAPVARRRRKDLGLVTILIALAGGLGGTTPSGTLAATSQVGAANGAVSAVLAVATATRHQWSLALHIYYFSVSCQRLWQRWCCFGFQCCFCPWCC